jgi:hypothetical protein
MPEVWPLSMLDPDEAQRLAKSHVCSRCWGDIVVGYDWRTRTSRISCATPGCDFPGLVSRKFVEGQEQRSMGELLEAHTALTRAGVLPRKSEAKLLKEMGF